MVPRLRLLAMLGYCGREAKCPEAPVVLGANQKVGVQCLNQPS